METQFESIIEANKASIYRLCRIYAVAPITPEDLFQEVLFQIWRSLKNFKGEAKVSTWVYRIALNVGIRSKHRLEKRAEETVRFDAISFKMATRTGSTQEEERFELLRACIETLDDAETSIIVLYLEDMRYREIATIIGLTENHVAVKMKRIRAKLKECMTLKINRP